jgi:DNA-binding MarR family transcriptional regulator
MSRPDVETVLRCYPRIFFACHRQHVRDEATQAVLSARQASVLDHLDELAGTSLFDLARHMGVKASSMSLMVDRLERGGYVTRERSSEDRRRVDLRLTPAGGRIRSQQKVLEPELVRAMLDRLTPAERREALAGLALLAEAASALIASGERTRILKGA